MGEGGSWNAAVIDLAVVAKDVVDGHRSLRGSGVSKHQFSSDITNRPEMRNRLTIGEHLHAIVDRHKPTLGLHSELFKVEGAAAGNTTSGNQNGIHLEGLNRLTGLHVDQFNLNRRTWFDRLGQNP